MLGEKFGGVVAVGEILAEEAEVVRLFEFGDACFLQPRIVVGAHAVDADNIAPLGQETPRDVRADKARGTSDKNSLAHPIRHNSMPAGVALPSSPDFTS